MVKQWYNSELMLSGAYLCSIMQLCAIIVNVHLVKFTGSLELQSDMGKVLWPSTHCPATHNSFI